MNQHFSTIESPLTVAVDCVVVGVYEGGAQSEAAQTIDKSPEVKGLITRLLKNGDFSGKAGSTHMLHELTGIRAPRVMLAGLGPLKVAETVGRHSKLSGQATEKLAMEKSYKSALIASAKAIRGHGIKTVANYLPQAIMAVQPAHAGVQPKLLSTSLIHAVVNTERARYQFAADKKVKDKPSEAISFYWAAVSASPVSRPRSAAATTTSTSASAKKMATELQHTANASIKQGMAVAWAMHKMLLVANQPPNVCTPSGFAEQAQSFVADIVKAKTTSPLKIKVMKPSDIRKMGMGSFLSVARGSEEGPRLVEIEYNGLKNKSKTTKTAKAAPIVLVGKGVTFDSGGISLKPGADMDHMKWDMCGAATVMAAVLACAHMDLPIHVVAVMPLTENMPSGSATRPGDVVKTMSGLTVEILNTDAEGRLILCDALTYAQKEHQPSTIIDIATLTGACVVALGSLRAGLFANDEGLANALIQASESALDGVWRLPLDDDYLETMKSNYADIANIGARGGAGTITAAMFLSKFIDQGMKWAHLDIAGVAYRGDGIEKGATGRPLPLIMQYLIEQAQA